MKRLCRWLVLNSSICERILWRLAFGKAALALAVFLLPAVAHAQFVPDSYSAAVSGQATTAAYLLSVEASALQPVRIVTYCVTSSPATAAAAVTVTVQRRTTAASSGGTALTAEGTGATAVSRISTLRSDGSAVPNFPGIARLNGTPGTAGAVIDQWSFAVGAIAADATPGVAQCRPSGLPPILIPAGVVNGISINVTAAGAGGLASGSISAVILMGQ